MERCEGEHRFFVADVAVAATEGKVVVIAICTSCGNVKSTEVQVTKPGGSVALQNKGEK